ncbi:MAG: hypothetical protein GVY28_02595 [Alphaproteobacteria bacterium]|jgi:hypothetical protein|nr:hypothetical protein [Alphaproteobacteria bacterium]
MGLSTQSQETLIDLVEIKISCMDVWDREDRRELAALERCLKELKALNGAGSAGSAEDGVVVDMPRRRRGRPPKREMAALHG